MIESTHDTIVVGLGGVGSAVFAELARRGVDVVGIDRWEPPHDRGSSHGQSRIFRVAYFEHPDYVPLARRARGLWLELEDRNDERIFIPTGGAWIGSETSEIVAGSLSAATQHQLEYELLDPEQVRRRWPALHAPRGSICFYEADTGTLCPENAITAFIREAVAAGGTMRCGEEVLRFEPEEEHVCVETKTGRIRARRVVIATGAWSGPLLQCNDLELRPQRQLLGWTRPRDPDVLREGMLPVWAFADEGDSFQYGFPICPALPGPDGFKIARHCDGEPCDPDTLRRTISNEDTAFLLEHLHERIPAAAGDLLHATVCMYTLSPDGHFLIDTHPDCDRIVMACGFSGHGFKFCPVLGEAIADLVLDGGTELPIGFLSRERFTGGGR